MKLGIVPLAAFYQSEIDHSQNDQFHRDMPPGLSGPEKAFYIQARRQALLGKGALDQF
jgi:hypothetical protein